MIKVRKRNGELVPFSPSKIKNAILKCFSSIGDFDNIKERAAHYTELVVANLFSAKQLYPFHGCSLSTIIHSCSFYIDIEEIQDTVVRVLAAKGEIRALIHYCEYRYQHKLEREKRAEEEYEAKLMAQHIVNQNANVDEYSAGGRSGEAADVYEKRYALEHLVSPMARKNHEEGFIYIHDLNKYSVGIHNCLSIPFDDLLSRGFTTRQGDVRPAGSLNTAFQLVAVIFQLQSLDQFGGASATHFDWTMMPYFKKSFMKHYMTAWIMDTPDFFKKDVLQLMNDIYVDEVGITRCRFDEWVEHNKASFFKETKLTEKDFSLSNKANLDAKYYQIALVETTKELKQAVEGMLHNLNTLQSRSGNQLPFTSINYGTCTEEEGRLITRALLLGSLNGIGFHHDTPIFPCGIFQYAKGINAEPGDPNYDLKLLALRSTSQRLYPNYANVDWSGNKGYDPKDPKTFFSTMGCHSYGTPIIMADGSKKPVQDIAVGDKIMGVNNSIRTVKSLIRGNGKLYKIIQSRGESYIVNEDHILALEYSANRKYRGLKKGEKINMSVRELLKIPENSRRFFKGYKDSYELPEKEFEIPPYILGLWLGDGDRNGTRFSVNINETKILEDLYKYAKSINKKIRVRREKFEKCLAVDVADRSTNQENKLRQGLKHYNLIKNKHIPECYFYGSKAQRSALLAGLINTDGWARTGRGRQSVCFGNTNLDLIKGAKRIADSLGCTTKIIKARDTTIGTGVCDNCILKPYYHLSIHGFDSELLMNNKRTNINPNSIRNFNTSTLKIEEVGIGDYYGFELDGDRLYLFNDCTVTHNCRTANGWDINGLGQLKDGRGNICPVTIIMPTIAMEAGRDTVKFLKLLDQKIHEAKDMLIERFNWICSQDPKTAPFMWKNHTMAGYIPEEGIRSALKHGTLAIGQLGLAETLQLLVGCNHLQPKGMKLAKCIEKMFYDRCKEFKEQYKLNFGVYYTPAENLCYTAMKKFKSKYGVIPNVSDRDYFTNSIHVPVWEEVTPFVKIDTEAQLTGYSSAGCITYVELPSTTKHNIKALETIVDYAMNKDIPYFAINVPNDACKDCGYTDEIGESCPVCGSKNIRRLRRVTGYLTTDYHNFNPGKIAEVHDRVKHIKQF